MIKSYKQLTGKYIKANKKRTTLTIVGIILSVALIASIGLFFKGMQNAEIEAMKNDYGSFHLAFEKVDEGLVSKITSNSKVSRSGLVVFGEDIKLGEKLSVNEVIASDKALELMPYRIKEGKFPENPNEAAIEKWFQRKIDSNAKLGSKIKINDKEYILTGILEDDINNQINSKGQVLLRNNNINMGKAMLLVEIKSNTNLKKALKELKQLVKKDQVSENAYLLMVMGAGEGQGFMGLMATLAVIIGIVLIATIAVIYNAFQISVVERIKQFGLLRAVGTTQKQIRRIVLREASLLAVIGIPIGLACGVAAIYGIAVAFKIIGGDSIKIMKPSVDVTILAISAIVGLASIYISALIPAFFAGRISPLVAINSRTSITKEKIKRRRNLIALGLFGFEGSMAAKNMKRSKKRYRITIFSIIISVVLFVTFKSFMDMTLNIAPEANESDNIHFSIVRQNEKLKNSTGIDDKTIEEVKALKAVDKVFKVYSPYYFQAAFDRNTEIKEVKDLKGIYNEISYEGTNKTMVNASIEVYDENSMEASKKYIKSGNIDIGKLDSENGVIIIAKNRIYNEETKRSFYGPIADLKVGDEVCLQYNGTSKGKVEFGKGEVNKVKVLAVLNRDPFNFKGDNGGLKIITTQNMAKKLIEKGSISPINLNIIIKNAKNIEGAQKEIENTINSKTALKLVNTIDRNKTQKSVILMVEILLYGFVIVISLIGSVNIINTLTTNIILRKREFASLKSIGLTQKGLRKMIVLEGFMYGIQGTIYGSIIGCGVSYLLFKGLSGAREFAWRIPWSAIGIAAVCAMLIGYISVIAPLSRIKKENLIEAIREE